MDDLRNKEVLNARSLMKIQRPVITFLLMALFASYSQVLACCCIPRAWRNHTGTDSAGALTITGDLDNLRPVDTVIDDDAEHEQSRSCIKRVLLALLCCRRRGRSNRHNYEARKAASSSFSCYFCCRCCYQEEDEDKQD